MAKKDEERIFEIKERYREAVDGWDHIYKAASEDMRFVYDVDEGQWPSRIREEREKDGRPVLTVNKLQKTLRRIRGDQLMNRIGMKVLPVDDKADPPMAELYSGLIREIEYLSNAEIAYDTAYNHAISSSVGFFRIITKYSDNNSFLQDIGIERIINPISVHFDPFAKKFSYEDAQYCFIEDLIDKKKFKRDFPNATEVDFDSSSVSTVFGDWLQQDKVRVAEYFYKEPTKEKIVQLVTGEIIPINNKMTIEAIKNLGGVIARERIVDGYIVKWCKLSGAEILEESEWPTDDIPIIPMFGDEVVVDGKKYYLSLARGAKGPQQMYNYWARLSLDTPIPTAFGWTTMGRVKEGEILFDENGKQCTVLGLSPIFKNRPCFKITFSNQTSIVADDEHFWEVEELNGKNWKTKTVHTVDLNPEKHRIRVAKPLELHFHYYAIPPYVLGLWITDGDSKRPKIFANIKTADELSGYLEEEGLTIQRGLICKKSETYGLAMLDIRKEFTKLKLLKNKHIPKEYLRGSFNQRLALLQGMMDGDGTCKKNGQCGFSTFQENIACEFAELLRSLGFKGNFNKQADGMYYFAFAPREFPVFRLKYKLNRQFIKRGNTTQSCRYSIVSIEKVPPVPVRCVKVNSPNSLFLAGYGMIPTHNTAATETVALAPKMPFILDHRQIKGFEKEWDEANRTNRMYIRYNAIAGLNKPARETQAQVPSAIMNMMQATSYDVEDHLGQYEASKGEASNERSGKAIIARVTQSDKGTYLFVDNKTRSIICSGRQVIKLIPKIYDTERALRVRGENGDESLVTVNKPVGFGDIGQIVKQNDLSVGKYDLIASTGASFSSKRQEMVQVMMDSMQYAPAIAPIIAPLIFEYMDAPGSKEIAAKINKGMEQMQQQMTQGKPPT